MDVSPDRPPKAVTFEEEVLLKTKKNKKNQKCKIPNSVKFLGVVVIAVAFFALGVFANHIYEVTSTFIQPTDKQRICPNFNMTISVTRKEVACDGMNITIFPSFDENQFIFCPSGTWQQSFNCSGYIFKNNGSGFCNEIKGLPNTFDSTTISSTTDSTTISSTTDSTTISSTTDSTTISSTTDSTTISSTTSFINRETSTSTEQEMNSFANS